MSVNRYESSLQFYLRKLGEDIIPKETEEQLAELEQLKAAWDDAEQTGEALDIRREAHLDFEQAACIAAPALVAEVRRLRAIIKGAEDVQVEYNDFEAAIMVIRRILAEAML